MAFIDWKTIPGCFQNVSATLPGASSATNVGSDVPTIQCVEAIFGNAVFAVVTLSGIAVFIMLLIGGFNFLFSGGDQKKVEQAQKTITNAIIGMVVIVAAYLILQTIGVFTGVNVNVFKISTSVPKPAQQFIRTH